MYNNRCKITWDFIINCIRNYRVVKAITLHVSLFCCEKCERLKVSRSSDFTRIKPPIFAKNHTKRIAIMRRENSEEKFYCLSLSAMADLLSSRADAYARLYFRVRVLWDVAQRPVSTHLFFLVNIER